MGKDNQHPCYQCTDCCEHVALEIERPTTNNDYQNIRWYLVHKNVSVFKASDDKKWYIMFDTRCEQLTDDGHCAIYETRPALCREYSADNCSRHGEGDEYALLFRNIREWDTWWDKKKQQERKRRKNAAIV